MRVVIAEDEILVAEHLKDIVKSFGYTIVGIAHNKEDVITLIHKYHPNLALLDIRMEGKYDGVEIGEYIMHHFNFPVIYITAHSDSEIISKALKTKPGGYIIKPFKAMDIYTAISIAVENFSGHRHENFVVIRDGYKTVKLFHYEINYLKSDNNYVEIHTDTGHYIERTSLEKMLQTLNSDLFMQVHRSFVINLDKVTGVKTSLVDLGDISIPVSRKYAGQLKTGFSGRKP